MTKIRINRNIKSHNSVIYRYILLSLLIDTSISSYRLGRLGGCFGSRLQFFPRPTMISETSQVFVGNLPYSVTWQELKMRFEQAGSVVRADVLQQKGRSKGFGRVAFESPLEVSV